MNTTVIVGWVDLKRLKEWYELIIELPNEELKDILDFFRIKQSAVIDAIEYLMIEFQNGCLGDTQLIELELGDLPIPLQQILIDTASECPWTIDSV